LRLRVLHRRGYDADFTIVDLKRSETITNQWVASRAAWTAYEGMLVTGWPVGTFIRGRRAMWQGELITPSTGEPVRFLETLRGRGLLLRKRDRELPVADAGRKAFDEFRHRVFTIGPNQFGERRKQAGLRQTVAIDAIVPGFRPGLVEVAERGLLLFVIGPRVARGREERWRIHETQQANAPQGEALRTREL
jgi:hypothetical protein